MASSLLGPPEPESPIAAHLARQAAEEKADRSLGLGWKVGPPAASLFDALATRDALNRGGREANPVMAQFADSTGKLVGVKLGTGILAAILSDRLAKAGHPNMARVVSAINIGVPVAAGTHNLLSGR